MKWVTAFVVSLLCVCVKSWLPLFYSHGNRLGPRELWRGHPLWDQAIPREGFQGNDSAGGLQRPDTLCQLSRAGLQGPLSQNDTNAECSPTDIGKEPEGADCPCTCALSTPGRQAAVRMRSPMELASEARLRSCVFRRCLATVTVSSEKRPEPLAGGCTQLPQLKCLRPRSL